MKKSIIALISTLLILATSCLERTDTFPDKETATLSNTVKTFGKTIKKEEDAFGNKIITKQWKQRGYTLTYRYPKSERSLNIKELGITTPEGYHLEKNAGFQGIAKEFYIDYFYHIEGPGTDTLTEEEQKMLHTKIFKEAYENITRFNR